MVNPHWNKVVFTGELDTQQVFDFYQLADVGAIPSLHEQCSFTAIEMRLNKLPMVTSSVDGLDEVFSHYHDSLKLSTKIDKAGERTLDEIEIAEKFNERIQCDGSPQISQINADFAFYLRKFTAGQRGQREKFAGFLPLKQARLIKLRKYWSIESEWKKQNIIIFILKLTTPINWLPQ
jgi:hypothetical protein